MGRRCSGAQGIGVDMSAARPRFFFVHKIRVTGHATFLPLPLLRRAVGSCLITVAIAATGRVRRLVAVLYGSPVWLLRMVPRRGPPHWVICWLCCALALAVSLLWVRSFAPLRASLSLQPPLPTCSCSLASLVVCHEMWQ